MAIFCFDFANTLAFKHEAAASQILSILSSEFNVNISQDEIERALRILDESYYFSSISMKSEKSKKEFYVLRNLELLKIFGIHDRFVAERIYEELTNNHGKWRLFPETRATLQKLSQNGHTLVLASNFDSNLKLILTELEIVHFFKVVQISEEVNVEKPDEAFFSLLLNQIKASSLEIFFIGDNRTLDYEPALKFGFIPILLDPYRIHPTVIRRIEKLNELLDFDSC